jgi:flagellar hook-basal body complex protein FliE
MYHPPKVQPSEDERLAAALQEVYDEITRRQDVANQQTTQLIQDRHYLPDAVMRRRQEMLQQAEFNGRFQAAMNALYDIASRAR